MNGRFEIFFAYLHCADNRSKRTDDLFQILDNPGFALMHAAVSLACQRWDCRDLMLTL